MKVVVWIVEGTWRACVDAARDTTPAEADTVLLYVVEDEVHRSRTVLSRVCSVAVTPTLTRAHR